MIYLREETKPSPFARVVEVTRRDSPGETIDVTPNDGVAYLFEMDASGRVVVASMRDGAGAPGEADERGSAAGVAGSRRRFDALPDLRRAAALSP